MGNKTMIELGDLQIRSMDKGSFVNMSRAIQHGNFVFNHRSEGFGEQSGDGALKHFTVSVVEDSDFIDSFIWRI